MIYIDRFIIIPHHCYALINENFVPIISIMLYIPKIDDYLNILTDDEAKDFVAINFSEYFKFTREKWYSKLSEEQNLRKTAESLYIFFTTPDEVQKYVEIMQSNSSDNCVHCYNIEVLNLFDPEFKLINAQPMIKNK